MPEEGIADGGADGDRTKQVHHEIFGSVSRNRGILRLACILKSMYTWYAVVIPLFLKACS